MKTLVPLLINLLWSASAFSASATLSSTTGILEIPHLVIDDRIALTGVDLMLTDAENGRLELVDYDFMPLKANELPQQELGFGETVTLPTGQQLRFIAVLSESRCPEDVVCISAGEVTVILRLTETLASGNTQRTDFGLTLLGTDISHFEYQGLYFRLAEVSPYPVSTEQIDDEDYSIVVEYRSIPFKN